MTWRPSNFALWFGVTGGPLAWAIQFVTNLEFSFAQCNQPTTRWQLPVHGWVIGLSIAGAAVAVAAMGVCARIFLRTFRLDDVFANERSGRGTQPPLGRVHFLSIVGLVVNLLALTIIVMTGIGAPLLPVCEQS